MHVVKQLHVLYDVTTWLFCAFHLNSKCCHWPMNDRQIHVVTRIISVSQREAKQSWIPGGITRQNQTSIISAFVLGNTESKKRRKESNYTVWYRHVSKHVKKLKLYQQNVQPGAMPQSKTDSDLQRDREPWID